MEILEFLPLILLSALVCWRPRPEFCQVLGAVGVFTGLAWYDNYVTDFGMAVSLSLILYGFAAFGMAFYYIFRSAKD